MKLLSYIQHLLYRRMKKELKNNANKRINKITGYQ